MQRFAIVALAACLLAAPGAKAQQPSDPSAIAEGFNAAHGDLPRSGGVAAQLANEAYVESLARVVYYWAYPALDMFSRTSMWEIMKDGPGTMLGVGPGAPVNTSGCIANYLPPTQRIMVTANNDTFYGVGFVDLGREPVVVQTPSDVPAGHYWTIQITDVFTNVVRQLGSASATPGGKFLLVGPDWKGEVPAGFIDTIVLPTDYGGAFLRSFAARTEEGKARAVAVQDQMGVYPLSQDQAGLRRFDCEAYTQNAVYPPGVTAEMIAANPDAARVQWVVPERFWDDLEKMLAVNPAVGADERAMAAQAQALIALRHSDPAWQTLLDKAALAADVALHQSAKYEQVGVDVGNGWQRQKNGGLWGTDWFGRAQAAVIYILVNDWHEAAYLLRGTDAKGALLNGRNSYTMTFAKDALPPVDRSRGGFWSLTLYDADYFMLPDSPNGRTNVGTVSLDANELVFAADGSLTITIAQKEPSDATAKANWLPAPLGQFSLLLRAYVPEDAILDSSYRFPEVEKR